jgi:hypothetical protein
MRYNLKILFLLSLLLPITAKVKLSGNGTNTTFKTKVGPTAIFQGNAVRNSRLYVGSAEELENNPYAVCFAQDNIPKFLPLFTQDVIFESNKNLTSKTLAGKSVPVKSDLTKTKNPLLAKAIANLGLLGFDVAIVAKTAGIPDNFIYLYSDDANNPKLRQTPILKDALGNDSGTIKTILSFDNGIVAAVTPNGSLEFGSPGSGLALVRLLIESVEDQKTKITDNYALFTATDAEEAHSLPKNKKVNDLNRAAVLDFSSNQVRINQDLSKLTPTASAVYSELELGYMSFDATSGASAGAGVKSLIKINVTKDDKLSIAEIAPNDIFTGLNDVVGGLGAEVNCKIKFFKPLVTSTRLTYLVIYSEINDQPKFYALPIVGAQKDKGSLASLNALPKEMFNKNEFVGRVFDVPALTAADFDLTNHPELMIGGNTALPWDKITALNVGLDAVFMTIGSGPASGVYQTSAIFNQHGVIAGWTPWTRYSAQAEISDLNLFEDECAVWTIENAGFDVFKTNWGYHSGDGILGGTSNDDGFIQFNNKYFSDGGVQGFAEFTSGGLTDIVLTVSTGIAKITVAKTGTGSAPYYTPVVGDYQSHAYVSEDGSWPTCPADAKIVAISGGDLGQLGPIVASTIYESASNWLVVGGYGGLAAMASENGAGWQNLSSLNFAGRFFKIGNDKKILKLASSNDWLYVLNAQSLKRIKLTPSSVLNNSYALEETLASATEFGFPLTDFAIFDNYVYLASGSKLFVLIDSKWTEIAIPGTTFPVSNINIIPAHLNSSAQLYVLTSYAGYNTSYLNRYYLSQASPTPIPLPDKFFKDSLTPFLNFGAFVNYFFTDGFRWLKMSAQNGLADAYLAQLKNKGRPLAGFKGKKLPFVDKSNLVVKGILLKSVGSFLINGSFGLWGQE